MDKKSIKTISGKNVEGYTHFAYDGCHKFYLLKSGILPKEFKTMVGNRKMFTQLMFCLICTVRVAH